MAVVIKGLIVNIGISVIVDFINREHVLREMIVSITTVTRMVKLLMVSRLVPPLKPKTEPKPKQKQMVLLMLVYWLVHPMVIATH